MAGTVYFRPSRSSTTRSHTLPALIRLSTTTHNLLTFNISEISLVLFKFPDVESHGRRITLALFSHQKKVLARVKVQLQFCSHLIHLTPKSLFPEAKDLVVTLEKRTVSYLSVSARIRVIDPFSQIKREYNTILDDADSANSNRDNFVPSQRFT